MMMAATMNESDFNQLAEDTMLAIEEAIDLAPAGEK
jgi:frataxin-like iron-binding protein CyaY